mmetsp:Transcript_8816/g.27343  ORF Transcript_8816/g.27343 Transcript_8816/m.27343 type:complete len:234 (+) Transcript_8816:59-760(+)
MVKRLPRCSWCHALDEGTVAYHDDVWGTPLRDQQSLFEVLSMVSQQGALGWLGVWARRGSYARAFRGLDMHKVARMSDARIEAIRARPDNGVIHHRGKLFALRNNARVFKRIERECEGGLPSFLWSFVPGGQPLCRDIGPRTRNPDMLGTPWAWVGGSTISDALARELRSRGVSHMGSTLLQAFLLQVGILNGHEPGCYKNPLKRGHRTLRRRPVATASAASTRRTRRRTDAA